MGKFNKAEKSWMMYDWASSAYSIIITTAIFPIYYKATAENAGVNPADATAYLGYTISISTFILALLGPVLGTIADFKGMKQKVLQLFLLDWDHIDGLTFTCTEFQLVLTVNRVYDYIAWISWSQCLLRCLYRRCNG